MQKVLVIEDDELVRDSVLLSLESAGYEVMEAASSLEGLQSQKQFGASVIISDALSLENEEGKAFQQFCLQSPGIPLITLMGSMSDSDTLHSDSAVSKSPHTLQKPFTLDELLATVENALTP